MPTKAGAPNGPGTAASRLPNGPSTTNLKSGGKAAAPKKLSVAAKKSLQRRVRITIGLAHRKLVAGSAQHAADLLDEAEKSCNELGADGEELLGEVHHALAYCHETLGDRTLCKIHLSMALDARKKTVGIVDPDMAATMGYLATIANLEGEYDKAMFFARQAITTWDLADHPMTDEVLQAGSALGFACRAAKSYPQAEAAYRDLASRLRKGVDKMAVATAPEAAARDAARTTALRQRLSECLKSLGEVYMESGDFEGSTHALEDAFREASLQFGFDDEQEVEPAPDPEPKAGENTVDPAVPDEDTPRRQGAPDLMLVEIKVNLANAYSALDMGEKALLQLQTAERIYDGNFRDKVNYLGASLLHAAGTVSYRLGNIEGAVEHYEQAIRLETELDTTATMLLRLKTMNNLAVLKVEQSAERTQANTDHLVRAHECFHEITRDTNTLFGPKTREASLAYAHLGWIENAMKRFEDSEGNYETALTIAGQATGFRSLFYAEALLDTAHAYVNTGKFVQAHKVSNQANSIFAQTLGPRYELHEQVKMFVEHVKIGEIPPQIQRKPEDEGAAAAALRVPGFHP